jgi:hypothetical protein
MSFLCHCIKKSKLDNLTQLCRHTQFNHYDQDNINFFCVDINCPSATKPIKGFKNIKSHYLKVHRFDTKFPFICRENIEINEHTDQQIDEQINQQSNQSLDLDSLSCSSNENQFKFPVLINQDILSEDNLVDKLCNLIIDTKKYFRTS